MRAVHSTAVVETVVATEKKPILGEKEIVSSRKRMKLKTIQRRLLERVEGVRRRKEQSPWW
jgi:hypothetical protein